VEGENHSSAGASAGPETEQEYVEKCLHRLSDWTAANEYRLADWQLAALRAGIETARTAEHIKILRLLVREDIVPYWGLNPETVT
jgi:hypothetical protein